jgi:uncharacterized protein
MSYSYDYAAEPVYSDGFAADAALAERVAFIRRTYAHLFAAILAFVGLLTVFFTVEPIKNALVQLVIGSPWAFLGVFVAFLVVSFLADRWAQSDMSKPVQYLGLSLYTLAEAVIFVPLIWIAQQVGGDQIVPTAGFLTLLIFGGLTLAVFVTKQDFSFLRTALVVCSLGALGLILASAIFGFSLGIVFTVAMIVLMSGFILYDTSNVLHHYRTDQHVAASLALFASIATLFWYVIRLLMYLNSD